ncbi:murein biosynthesis integral membrane protein MurJ [Pediococcus pentosaceus]|uniref:murein biosynthesis integral membrane protein MurJ n=1 Tax=Pediococcus pentosaceus TaxID=1255 RepID=UPI00190E55DD|nr:lipid II flippase MurJ [Pediococcus pentosaceus]MBF7124917.1 hypothetical protein [Pediococcus pentosaceus]WPK17128.1 lipid II flippase MurJ [Pediococcus pentosaceus]
MKKITYSFPIVIIVSLLTQLFGLGKTLILAKNFGANGTLDAFYLANTFTISVFTIVGSSIMTVVIPSLNEHIEWEEVKKSVESYTFIVKLISIAVSVLLFVVLFLGINIVAPKFSTQNKELFIVMTAILLISQQFKIQASMQTSFSQNEGMYIMPKVLDIIPYAIPFLYLIVTPKMSIIALTIFVGISYALETIVFNYIQKRINPKYTLKLKFKLTSRVRSMLLDTIPILISSTVFQIQILISNYFAGTFGKGYITLLSNTNQIMGIFQSLFVVNLINMIYPRLVKDLKDDFIRGLQKVDKYISLTNLVIVILIWGFLATGQDLVNVLFVRGAFSHNDARIVFNFCVVIGIVIQFDVIRDYFYRIFYARGDTKTPMLNSINTVLFNVIFLVILANVIGPISIVLAPACGTIYSLVSISIRMNKARILPNLRAILKRLLLMNLAGAAMYLLIKMINIDFHSSLINLLINICIGAVFIGILGLVSYVGYKTVQKRRNLEK